VVVVFFVAGLALLARVGRIGAKAQNFSKQKVRACQRASFR